MQPIRGFPKISRTWIPVLGTYATKDGKTELPLSAGKVNQSAPTITIEPKQLTLGTNISYPQLPLSPTNRKSVYEGGDSLI